MPETPQRIVSLCPSLTETLFDLGVGDRVVGATKFCVHPREGMEHVRRVGGTKDPKLEAIAELRPDVVFMNREENRREDAERLRSRGLRVEVSFPQRVADIPTLIRELAEVVGVLGDAWTRSLEAEMSACEAHRLALVRPIRFLVLVWRGPWMAAGADTFLSDLLCQAGGTNALGAESTRYPEVTLADISAMAPDRILLPSEPYPFKAPHRDELVSGARIPSSRFLSCDGELLTWHGTRTVLGLRAARGWLVGD